MWLAWSERVNVYLGTGVVLVQRPGHPLWSFMPPVTLPLGDVLNQVDEACRRSQAIPWRLSVHLSAALCPPVAFAVPIGVNSWQETMAVARATAVATWELPPEQAVDVVCTLDTQHTGLAAALRQGTHQQIGVWAGLHGGRLISMQPLWVTATRAKACRIGHVNGLTLHEPDALTTLDTSGVSPRANCWLGHHTTEQARALVEGWMLVEKNAGAASTGTQKNPLTGLGVKFSEKPFPLSSQWRDGPTVWTPHWETVS